MSTGLWIVQVWEREDWGYREAGWDEPRLFDTLREAKEFIDRKRREGRDLPIRLIRGRVMHELEGRR